MNEEARFTNVDDGLAGTPADLCPTGGEGKGGAIVAAKFLKACSDAVHFAHLDVSNVAKATRDLTGQKAVFSTGFGPFLLAKAVANVWSTLVLGRS